jgi:L-fucose mutarotase/ribose pyranase (RbsD/FucU family)
MNPSLRLILILFLALASGRPLHAAAPAWQQELQSALPRLGHRNWIAIVDSAYPRQSAPGITLVATGADHLTVVAAVLDALGRANHVRPRIYLDAELPYVAEKHAPGIGRFRAGLGTALGARPVLRLPHEEIIRRLDQASHSFEVLVLKTTLALPYTSVFIELECGYWSEEAEQGLRAAMAAGALPK